MSEFREQSNSPAPESLLLQELRDLIAECDELEVLVELSMPAGEISCALDRVAAWQQRIWGGDHGSDLIEEINADLTLQEQEHPDAAQVRDQLRTVLAFTFVGRHDNLSAQGIMERMHSAQHMAWALRGAETHYGNRVGNLEVRLAMDMDGDPALLPRQFEFIRALIDHDVQFNNQNPQLPSYERWLARHDPNYDPIDSWATTFGERAHWPARLAAAAIRNDELWRSELFDGELTRLDRQVMYANYATKVDRLWDGNPCQSDVARVLGELAESETRSGGMKFYDHLRLAQLQRACSYARLDLAKLFAQSVRDAVTHRIGLKILVEWGAPETALDILLGMTDGAQMAEALRKTPWPGTYRNTAVNRVRQFVLEDRNDAADMLRQLDVLRTVGEPSAGESSGAQSAVQARIAELERRLHPDFPPS